MADVIGVEAAAVIGVGVAEDLVGDALIPFPYPWTMGVDRNYRVRPLNEINGELGGIVRGEMSCAECGTTRIKVLSVNEAIDSIVSFILATIGDDEVEKIVPREWEKPAPQMCADCRTRSSSALIRPLSPSIEQINWLFLFLDNQLGKLTFNQLRRYCIRNNIVDSENVGRLTKGKLLYRVYVDMLCQLGANVVHDEIEIILGSNFATAMRRQGEGEGEDEGGGGHGGRGRRGGGHGGRGGRRGHGRNGGRGQCNVVVVGVEVGARGRGRGRGRGVRGGAVVEAGAQERGRGRWGRGQAVVEAQGRGGGRGGRAVVEGGEAEVGAQGRGQGRGGRAVVEAAEVEVGARGRGRGRRGRGRGRH